MNPDGFLRDVLEEPATLRRVLEAARDLRLPELERRRVVLLGMGSSRFAALTAAAALRVRGIAAWTEYASTAAPTPPGPDVVAIGISASGSTEETVAALVRHRGVSQTVAITNDAGAALAAAAEVVVELNAGVEAGGVACKTFQATLALLHVLAGADVDSLLAAVDVQAAVLEGRSEWLPELVGLVRYAHTIYTLAPAERLSSALQGALMLREGPRVAAVPTETGDWLHVDVYLSKHPGYVALLFTGSRFDAAVMDWARQRASRIVCVGAALPGAALHIPLSAGSPAVASLAEVAVAELLAAELWRERLDAGVMP